MQLKENERLDEVNDRLSLIQNTEGLTFGTDALLLAAYIGRGYKSGIELGGGTGIISMLLATRGKIEKISCVEIQEEYAELILCEAKKHAKAKDDMSVVLAKVSRA